MSRVINIFLLLFVFISFSSVVKAEITLNFLGTYASGIFDDSAAEIVAYDKDTERLFVTNSANNTIDIVDISSPAAPLLFDTIDLSPYGAGVNSVAIYDGLVAVAVEADPKQDPGTVAFFDADGNYENDLTVGALPDMLTFAKKGKYLLVANEGEPDHYCEGNNDPEGSVSIVNLKNGVNNATVTTADFNFWDNKKGLLRSQGVRIFGPGATVSQDLEPEYITPLPKGKKAVVSLQENNAFAILNYKTGKIETIVGLGTKNHKRTKNALDPSDDDGGINIQPWPVRGMYQPDAIDSFKYQGQNFIASANEGDAREYFCLLGGEQESEENEDPEAEDERVKDLVLDPVKFPDAATLQQDENLGRLNVTLFKGDQGKDGDFERLFSFGARSFSIWNQYGQLVYDSGDDFEQITAVADEFNNDNDENDFDGRSDAKGPEPEAIKVARVFGERYAFIGLERIGGVMIYNISDPYAPYFVDYINNRDFTQDPEGPNPENALDLGPESIIFIKKGDSPINKNLLVVANEVSGTTTIYQIVKD